MNTKIKNNYRYILSNKDIFSIAESRIEAEQNGATVFIPHVCNNIDLFGAGFAAAIAEQYPEVKANYHMLGKNFLLKNLGHSQIIKIKEDKKYKHSLYAVNMIAQNGIINPKTNPRPLNYEALVNCMVNIRNYIKYNRFDKVEIHAPKFGGTRSGGDWKFISDIIDDVWQNIPVVIYNYNMHKNNRYDETH